MMRSCLIIFFFLLVAFGTTYYDGNGEVMVRVQNISKYDFENVILDPSKEAIELGDIPSGKLSNYKAIDTTYTTISTRFISNGDTLVYYPKCLVGEEPLEPGKYTFVLACCETTVQEDLLNEGDSTRYITPAMGTLKEVGKEEYDTLCYP